MCVIRADISRQDGAICSKNRKKVSHIIGAHGSQDLGSPSTIMALGYNQCVVHVPKSDMELLQFLAATDHDIFSCVVFLNWHKPSTPN